MIQATDVYSVTPGSFNSVRPTPADPAADADQWPTFGEAALTAGHHTAYAVPMRLRGTATEALTLLNTEPSPRSAIMPAPPARPAPHSPATSPTAPPSPRTYSARTPHARRNRPHRGSPRTTLNPTNMQQRDRDG